jgi:hypothetical protein
VIELGTALASEDTTLVEHDLIGLNSDGGWLLGNGSRESIVIIDGDVSETGVLEGNLGSIVLALLVNSLVWVVRLELNTELLNVLEGLVHETTIATLVTELLGAINELLLREGEEVTILDGIETLKGTGGRESPA